MLNDDTTWEEYCYKFGVVDKDEELSRLKEPYKTDDRVELMILIRDDYL